MRPASKLGLDRSTGTIGSQGFRSHQVSMKNSLHGSPQSQARSGNSKVTDEYLQNRRLSKTEYFNSVRPTPKSATSAYATAAAAAGDNTSNVIRREINTPTTNQFELDDTAAAAAFDDFDANKLPMLSEVINMKFRNEDKELHLKIIEIVRHAHNLENIVKYKNREIDRLQYLIKYLTIAQQKRDEMLSHIQEENRKIKEHNTYLESTPLSQSGLVSPSIHQKKTTTQGTSNTNELVIPSQSSNMQNNAVSASSVHQITSINQSYGSAFKSPKKSNLKTNGSHRKLMISAQEIPDSKELLETTQQPKRGSKSRTREGADDQLHSILTISLDSDTKKFYQEKEFVQQLSGIIEDEDLFIQQVKNLEYLGMITLFDSIQRLLGEHRSLFNLIFRLRKLLRASTIMNESRIFDETLDILMNEACLCLESDQASVFIFDQESEELWTKAIKGSNKTIKVPYDKGIVGAVFTTGQYLNVNNAYNDERFHKDIDKMMNYKTNTILAFPIFDKDGNNVIGVIQAVNKLRGQFSKDDEGLLYVLAQMASLVLRNSEQFDSTIMYQNNLRTIIHIGSSLSACKTIEDLVVEGEKKLKDLFSGGKGRILIADPGTKTLFCVNSETKQRSYHSPKVGIAGLTFIQNEILNIPNAYNHQNFNSETDIDTSMPIISMPIRKDKNQEAIAVLQVVNQRGIQGLSATNQVRNQFKYILK